MQPMTVTLDKEILESIGTVSRENACDVETYRNALQDVVVHCRRELANERLLCNVDYAELSVKAYRNWWEHFVCTCLPRWLRGKVQPITVRKRIAIVVKAAYPSIAMHDRFTYVSLKDDEISTDNVAGTAEIEILEVK